MNRFAISEVLLKNPQAKARRSLARTSRNPLEIRRMLGVPPKTRCKYVPVSSSPTSMLVEVLGGTPNTRRIVREFKIQY